MNTKTNTSHHVALFHDTLNTSIYRVTPLADGMEHVDYLGCLRDLRETRLGLLTATAEGTARSTGSKSATVEDGDTSVTWYGNRYAARITSGTHRARTNLTREQSELRTEYLTQRNTTPEVGERRVVAEMTGYVMTQHRPLGHQRCGCHDGTTTYTVGTVAKVILWADNSVEALVELPNGCQVREELVAPHGDAC